MNRALRAATMGVLLVSPVALSACSAGQVTQTATQQRDKAGAMAQVGDLTLRQVQLLAPRRRLRAGDDAELQLAVVNTGTEADTLVDVSGEGFGDVEFDSGSTPRAFLGRASRSRRRLGDLHRRRRTVTLTDLDDALTAGQSLELTFTFENAGDHPPRHRRHAGRGDGARRGVRLPPGRGHRRARARRARADLAPPPSSPDLS